MGAVLGLLLGVGMLLIWLSFQAPPPSRPARTPRLRPLLGSAGLGEVSVAGFVAVCVLCALRAMVSTAAVLVASRTVPVALVFGAMGGYLPMVVLNGRARRRQRELAEVWPEAVDNLASPCAGPNHCGTRSPASRSTTRSADASPTRSTAQGATRRSGR